MLVPTHVDFLLITALEEERDAVLKRLAGFQQLPPTHDDVRVYYTAKIQAKLPGGADCTYSAIVCMVGMGRVPATAGTTEAIRRWAPDYVVLIGIAGGLKSSGVGLGDILIAEQIADYQSQKITKEKTEIRWRSHPVDHRLLEFSRSTFATAWQDNIGEPRPNGDQGQPKRHVGTVTTGDAVIAVDEILESFKEKNWPKLIGVEMEAGGAVESAHQSVHRPGFFMVRSVSDLAGNKASKRVKAWRPYACDAAAAFALTLIRSGPVPPKGLDQAAITQSDDLATEMSKLTFGELETVTNYLVEQPAKSGVDYSLVDPEEKMKRNGLGKKTHDLFVLGLSKVQLVTQYVDHVTKIDQRFPEKLKGGFLVAYSRLRESGLEGDALFEGLAGFACRNDRRTRYQAAGLAVLTYLFEICDVFEK